MKGEGTRRREKRKRRDEEKRGRGKCGQKDIMIMGTKRI